MASLFEQALARFVAMIDLYLGELIPARRGYDTLVALPSDPLCLRGRDAMLDVLPLAWDICAPMLGVQQAAALPAVPQDPAACATLLREWDDHLFALGLAPLRAVYQRAGTLLQLGDDVFCLTPPECLEALKGATVAVLIDARRAAWCEAKQLHPPLRIIAGEPANAPTRWLRGLPIGESTTGTLAVRRDLQHLRDEPVGDDAIVALPSLTAPAAVVIHRMGIRAICAEYGGALSHAALIARELRLSALLGCRGCTSLPDGTWVELDMRTGALRQRGNR